MGGVRQRGPVDVPYTSHRPPAHKGRPLMCNEVILPAVCRNLTDGIRHSYQWLAVFVNNAFSQDTLTP